MGTKGKRLKKEDIDEIMKLLAEGMSVPDIMELTEASKTAIYNIRSRRAEELKAMGYIAPSSYKSPKIVEPTVVKTNTKSKAVIIIGDRETVRDILTDIF